MLTNLISKIEKNHPSLLEVKENTQFAINCNLVRKNVYLNEGDQIAIFSHRYLEASVRSSTDIQVVVVQHRILKLRLGIISASYVFMGEYILGH